MERAQALIQSRSARQIYQIHSSAESQGPDVVIACEGSGTVSPDDGSKEGKKPKTLLEIHVYRPHESLGGILSLLNFDRKFLSRMIKQGYKDALDHDCDKNGCLLLKPDPM